MISLNNLPIITLTEDNIKTEWHNLLDQIKQSTFIAIDIELSGLGNRKNINIQSIDDRYKAICEIAKSYSILSWGISCFKIKNLKDNEISITNKTYDLLTLCGDNYMVDSESLKFLQNHGFDFNLHVSKGIKYFKGNDCKNNLDFDYIRKLLIEISLAKVPIVLHNGLIDLIFIYENFYANCPSTFLKFVADLSEIFSNGILDTKYIVDFHVRYSASYLEYLFLKSYYENTQNKIKNRKSFIDIEFINESNEDVLKLEEYNLKLNLNDDYVSLEDDICKMYSKYGFCQNYEKKSCTKLHNTNLILNVEIIKNRIKCKKKRQLVTNENEIVNKKCLKLDDEKSTDDDGDDNKKTALDSSELLNCAHTSGIDAFMTGYAFAYFLQKYSNLIQTINNCSNFVKLNDLNVISWLNNVYLTGKDYPLIINKSSFVTTSLNHQEKMRKINQK